MRGSYILPLLASSLSNSIWTMGLTGNSTFPPMAYTMGNTRIGFHRRKRLASGVKRKRMAKASRRTNRK